MRRSLYCFQFIGWLFTVTFGALLHFAFETLGRNPILAAVASVNESTWEHMKLLFFPSLFAAVAGYFIFGRRYADYWRAKLAGIVLGLLLIPALYYSCVGIFGKAPDWFNILSFFLAAAAQFALETHILCAGTALPPGNRSALADSGCRPFPIRRLISSRAAFAALCLIALAFILFTYDPPHIPLFRDPVTGAYGIPK